MTSTSGWTPLLTGEAASQALARARALVLGSPLAEASVLCKGLAGQALALAWIAPDAHGQAACLREAAWRAALGDPRLDPSFWTGLTGLAWVTALAPPGAEVDLSWLVDEVDPLVFEPLQAGAVRGFDLVSGLAGVAVYALHRLPHPAAVSALERCVEGLRGSAERQGLGLAWRTPASVATLTLPHATEGCFDTGPAHGATGAALALARCVEAGVAVEQASELLEGVLAWLAPVLDLPAAATALPDRVLPGGAMIAGHSSWCRGSAGVAASLKAVADLSGDRRWDALARQAVDVALRRPDPTPVYKQDRMSLCHGLAGRVHCWNRLWQATGDPRCRRQALDALDALLLSAPEPGATRDPSLLGGDAGVALVLHAAATDHAPRWDAVFGLGL